VAGVELAALPSPSCHLLQLACGPGAQSSRVGLGPRKINGQTDCLCVSAAEYALVSPQALWGLTYLSRSWAPPNPARSSPQTSAGRRR
jgi:hypothetical protein